jgi:2-dehydropantoate 2-reductase
MMHEPNSTEPHIAFVGAGAMGSYIGGRIAQSGGDVVLVDPWSEHIDAIKRDGVQLFGTEGESTARVAALHIDDVQALKKTPVDIAFIAVKSYDTEWAAEIARDYLAPNGFVVSLQNGINEPAIAGIVGPERTLGCIASTIGLALRGPGRVERTYRPGGEAYTVFRVGELDGRLTPRLERVVSLLRTVDSAEATSDLAGERWAKLAANSMHNGLAAVTGLGHKGIYSQEQPRRLAIRLGAEAVRVGRAAGVNLHPVRGIPADDLEGAGYGDRDALERVEAVIQGWMPRLTDEGRPSTAQDVTKARRTEIDYINGAVCARAAEVNVPVPCQHAITNLVKRIERAEMAPSPANIEGL